jgi:drug/metabolite transporter (DMT)-like permease
VISTGDNHVAQGYRGSLRGISSNIMGRRRGGFSPSRHGPHRSNGYGAVALCCVFPDCGGAADCVRAPGLARHLLLTTGYEQATAGAGALLTTGLLTIFSLAVPLAFSSAKPSSGAVFGALLACVGLGVFAACGSGRTITASGFAIFSTAALSWAALNALIRYWKIDPLQLTVGLALWSVLFLPVYTSIRPWHALSGPAPELLLQFVYQGWLVAFVATLLFFIAIRYAGAPTAAALQALAPGVSSGLGAILLAEPIGRLQIVGLAITILGVMFASGGERWLTGLLGHSETRRRQQAATG